MKKTLLILMVALVTFVTDAEAQRAKYSYHRPGYWGNIELNGAIATGLILKKRTLRKRESFSAR